MKMLPYWASDFLRRVMVCEVSGRVEGAVMLVPDTLEMIMGGFVSMVRMAEFEPVVRITGMEKVVPVKEKVMPVPDQVSSLVAGLTRPRYWKVADEDDGVAADFVVFEEAVVESEELVVCSEYVVVGLEVVVVGLGVAAEDDVVFGPDIVGNLVLLAIVVGVAVEVLETIVDGPGSGMHCEYHSFETEQ